MYYPAAKTINPASAIQLASAKADARFKLQEHGVAIPETVWYNDGVGVVNLLEKHHAVVVRPYKHRAGKDFYLCNSTEEVADAVNQIRANGGDRPYVSQYIKKTAEYRVHVAHGLALLVNKKEARNLDGYKQPIWNHAVAGFYFRVIGQNQWRISAVRLAIQAVECLGLDFGAVDILYNGQPYVCEVNTAPSLEDYAATRYAEYFDWLISTEGKVGHFPLPDTDYKRDYVFRGGAE